MFKLMFGFICGLIFAIVTVALAAIGVAVGDTHGPKPEPQQFKRPTS